MVVLAEGGVGAIGALMNRVHQPRFIASEVPLYGDQKCESFMRSMFGHKDLN